MHGETWAMDVVSVLTKLEIIQVCVCECIYIRGDSE